MKRGRRRQASRELIEAQRSVNHWRREHGGRGSRIPDEIWEAAVAAARVDGVWATSRVLRVEYSRLKRRVECASGGDGQACAMGPSEASAFMEVGMTAWAARPRPMDSGTTVIELMGRHGERMRVEVSGESTMDVVGLSQAFWSGQS